MKLTSKRVLVAAALVFAVGVSSAFAQGKKELTLDDIIAGGKGYAEKAPRMMQVVAVTNLGAVVKKGDTYSLIDKAGEEHEFLTLEGWKAFAGTDEKGLPMLSMNADNGVLVAENAKGLFVFDEHTKTFVQKYGFDHSKFATTDLSVKGKRIALMDGKNIFILDAEGNMTSLTTDGTDDIVYGTAAHRNEFNTERGTLWSPSGRYLAYYRIDRTNVEAYPIVDMNSPIAKLVHYKYPMAGRVSESVSVHIHDTQNNTTQVIKSDWPSDAYFTNWAWSPDEKLFYIDEVARSQNEGRLVAYSPSTGEQVGVVMTESHDKYVEPSAPLQFVPGHPDLFVRTSRVEGYNHIYLHNVKGKRVRRLTSGDWEVKALIGMDAKGKYVYYVSNEGYHIGQALWRVPVSGGKRECLTSGEGFHFAMISPDKSLVIDNFSNLNTPGRLSLVTTTGKIKSRTLDTAKNLFEGYNIPAVELGTIKAADGKTDLYYKMTRPAFADRSSAGRNRPSND